MIHEYIYPLMVWWSGYAATGGILDGIFILLNKGFRRAIIQTDNFKVAQILSDLGLEDLGITVLKRTQCIMSLNWKSTLQVFDEVPKEILDLLQEDKDN
ncbi:hypothetical protein Goari_023701, partial [Gossypium aridum]|nr:hypothetical protein [Gossypium aridum]